MKFKKQLMARSIKKSMFGILLFLILGIVSISYSLGDLLKYNKGPVDFEKLSTKEMEGKYVKLDVYYNYGGFLEEYVTKNNVKQRTTKIYYCIPIGNDGADYYEGLGAICVPVKHESKMEKIANNTYNYLEDEETPLDDHLLLEGVVVKMDSETKGYLRKYLINSGYTAAEADEIICPYVLDVTSPRMTNALVFVVFGVCFAGVAIIWLLYIVLGLNQRKINKTLKQQGQFAMEEVDSDYEASVQLAKNIRLGKKYTYIFRTFRPIILVNMDILWLYYGRTQHYTNGIKSGVTYTVNYGMKTGKLYSFSAKSEDAAIEVVAAYDQRFHHIVLGFNKDLQKTFRKNRQEFMDIRYNQSLQEEMYGEYPQD